MWGIAAVCCGSIAMAAANRIFESHTWQAALLSRENVAVQALAAAEKWFVQAVKSDGLLDPSDFELSALPKDDPLIQIPCAFLAELKSLNKGTDIEIFVADQHYSSSFSAQADTMGIPMCGPSEISVNNADGTSPDIYSAKRFLIGLRIMSESGSKNFYTVSKNMLVLKDKDGAYKAVSLYTKKR
jgi:hypothetical protein